MGGGDTTCIHHCTNYSQIKLNFADLWSLIPTKINHLTNCCGNVLPHQPDSHGWSVHHSGQGCGQVWGWLKFEFVLRTTYCSSTMSQLCARPTQSTTGILNVHDCPLLTPKSMYLPESHNLLYHENGSQGMQHALEGREGNGVWCHSHELVTGTPGHWHSGVRDRDRSRGVVTWDCHVPRGIQHTPF